MCEASFACIQSFLCYYVRVLLSPQTFISPLVGTILTLTFPLFVPSVTAIPYFNTGDRVRTCSRKRNCIQFVYIGDDYTEGNLESQGWLRYLSLVPLTLVLLLCLKESMEPLHAFN